MFAQLSCICQFSSAGSAVCSKGTGDTSAVCEPEQVRVSWFRLEGASEGEFSARNRKANTKCSETRTKEECQYLRRTDMVKYYKVGRNKVGRYDTVLWMRCINMAHFVVNFPPPAPNLAPHKR